MPRPATQDWVHNISVMQQSVLLSAIRGPDGVAKFHQCKPLLKWYRRCVLISAFDGKALTNPVDGGGGSFTGPSIPTPINWKPDESWYSLMEPVVDSYVRSQDELSHHFQMHFLHAAEILGYKHPDIMIKSWWFYVYHRLVDTLHLYPESEEAMDSRLGDNEAQWRARADPAATCSD